MKRTKCPTCGSAVEMASSDEGTNSYLEITTRLKAKNDEYQAIIKRYSSMYRQAMARATRYARKLEKLQARSKKHDAI